MTDKNFDEWNEQKKDTHANLKNKWVCKREVWWVAFGTNVGTEIDGRGKKFLRPALILKVFGFSSTLVIPLTSKYKQGVFYVNLGKIDDEDQELIANLGQIRVVDTKRCIEKMGQVAPGVFSELKKAIRDFLK